MLEDKTKIPVLSFKVIYLYFEPKLHTLSHYVYAIYINLIYVTFWNIYFKIYCGNRK
jgi:hypothetical protein